MTNKITRNVRYNNYSTCQQLVWLVNDVCRLLPARRSQLGATVLAESKQTPRDPRPPKGFPPFSALRMASPGIIISLSVVKLWGNAGERRSPSLHDHCGWTRKTAFSRSITTYLQHKQQKKMCAKCMI